MKRCGFRYIFPCLASLFYACGAHGQGLPGLLEMQGECRELVIGKDVLTARCKAAILNSSYDDGRVGFYFFFDADSVVTFSGKDLPNPGPDTDEFAIDRVIRGSAAVAAQNLVATGKCSFGNPYKHAVKVYCSGKLDNGTVFSSSFMTDGKPPRPLR